jgi:hypothetical protein
MRVQPPPSLGFSGRRRSPATSGRFAVLFPLANAPHADLNRYLLSVQITFASRNRAFLPLLRFVDLTISLTIFITRFGQEFGPGAGTRWLAVLDSSALGFHTSSYDRRERSFRLCLRSFRWWRSLRLSGLHPCPRICAPCLPNI